MSDHHYFLQLRSKFFLLTHTQCLVKRYTKNGLIATAGFSDPNKDPLEDDLKLWMPDDENPAKDLDLRMARYLLAQVGDQFCDLYQQEKDAMSHHMSDGT